jgi:hypothetical protein
MSFLRSEKLGKFRGSWETAHAPFSQTLIRVRSFPLAGEAFAAAAAIIGMIAGNIGNERLRMVFLNSAAVREVLQYTCGSEA